MGLTCYGAHPRVERQKFANFVPNASQTEAQQRQTQLNQQILSNSQEISDCQTFHEGHSSGFESHLFGHQQNQHVAD